MKRIFILGSLLISINALAQTAPILKDSIFKSNRYTFGSQSLLNKSQYFNFLPESLFDFKSENDLTFIEDFKEQEDLKRNEMPVYKFKSMDLMKVVKPDSLTTQYLKIYTASGNK